MADDRFARLKTDPRFRRPKKNKSKIVLDERFQSVLSEEKKARSKSWLSAHGALVLNRSQNASTSMDAHYHKPRRKTI